MDYSKSSVLITFDTIWKRGWNMVEVKTADHRIDIGPLDNEEMDTLRDALQTAVTEIDDILARANAMGAQEV